MSDTVAAFLVSKRRPVVADGNHAVDIVVGL